MLVLSRKKNEKIKIGSEIAITIVEIIGDRVKIGITAPTDIEIKRGELVQTWEGRRKNSGLERPAT